MPAGTEFPTAGRLFDALIQAVKGRIWSGTYSLKPEMVELSATSRAVTLDAATRTVIPIVISRTVTMEVTN